jgi:hypothetical protein
MSQSHCTTTFRRFKHITLRSYLRCPFLLLMNNGSHRKTTANFLFLTVIDDEKHDHP